MPVKTKKRPTTAHLRQMSADALETKRPLLRLAFQMAAEAAVTYARDEVNTYRDRTGNLRSSIGFIIAENGRSVAASSFEPISASPNRPMASSPYSPIPTGSDRGRQLAERIVMDNNDADLLGVLVAGMPYAYYVQNLHHLDVLAGASLIFETELKTNLKAIR